jgi:hypothetical protein
MTTTLAVAGNIFSRSKSVPRPSGKFTSSSTASKDMDSAARRASATAPTAVTSAPSFSRKPASRLRNSGSSSSNRMLQPAQGDFVLSMDDARKCPLMRAAKDPTRKGEFGNCDHQIVPEKKAARIAPGGLRVWRSCPCAHARGCNDQSFFDASSRMSPRFIMSLLTFRFSAS